jgi:mRNA interferase MazF
MPGKILRRGDIVLVPFPFTDQTAKKVRPATIVSSDPQGGDIIIAFISSVVSKEKPDKRDFILMPDDTAFPSTGLRRASVFRMSKLLTIERSLIVRRLGKVSPDLQARLDECLKHALGLS